MRTETLRPRDVVSLRSSSLRAFKNPGWFGGLVDFLEDEQLATIVVDGLRRSDLYLIGSEMLDLVGHAAITLPDHAFHQTDPLSHIGLCIFARPLLVAGDDTFPFIGFSWLRVAWGDGVSDGGIHVTWWGRPQDMRGYAPDMGSLPPLIPGLSFVAHEGEHWVKGDHGSPAGGNDTPAWLAAFWRIAKEEWVDISRQTPNAERRAASRAKRPPSSVRVVTLRRPAAESHVSDEGGSVDWSHRWWVNGHWRNQWFPSQQRHAPRWIRGHIKGPEDKPFVGKETVHVLRR